MTRNVWDYRASVWDYCESTWTLDSDLLGYGVTATDGSIGTVDEVARDAGTYVVVDTSPWVVGEKRLVPAGAITSLDHDAHLVQLDLYRAQVRDGPRYFADRWDDEAFAEHGDYYGRCIDL